jgi:hypothetical protein
MRGYGRESGKCWHNSALNQPRTPSSGAPRHLLPTGQGKPPRRVWVSTVRYRTLRVSLAGPFLVYVSRRQRVIGGTEAVASTQSSPSFALRAGAIVVLAIAMTGCASVGSGLVGADDVGTLALNIGGQRVPGQPVDLYLRVARGAKSCWLRPGGPLAVGYVFAADVRPEDKGGGARITIFTAAAEYKRGLKAFSVTMIKAAPAAGSSGDGDSLIGSENAKIAEPLATQMQNDALRWANGDPACAGNEANWTAQQPAEAAAEAPAKASGKTPTKGPPKVPTKKPAAPEKS